jgi:hypothetical protein
MEVALERALAQNKPSGGVATAKQLADRQVASRVQPVTRLRSPGGNGKVLWSDNFSDSDLVSRVLRLQEIGHQVVVVRNLSTPFPRREVMLRLQQLDVPLLALPDDITRQMPDVTIIGAVRKALLKYMEGRKARPRNTSADRSSALKPTSKLGRGPLSDEERQIFKDAFLGQVQLDDGIR